MFLNRSKLNTLYKDLLYVKGYVTGYKVAFII